MSSHSHPSSAQQAVPAQPENSFRVTLETLSSKPRIDQVLLEALRGQSRNPNLKRISRTEFKELFKKKKILIKGQPATPSSSLASGVTHVDILGYSENPSPDDPTLR
ncbi:MAG: hypothetical protein H7301_12910 [Cryobacterium sp.]|nr:hypothetical protein [Oligoflexia bacterium]